MKKTKSYYLKYIPDKLYLQIMFLYHCKKFINFKNPKTYNEKLQWLKIYDRKPEYTQMVDKYRVRDYIKKQIGEKYLIPLLGVWDKVEDINFEDLPNQFVLKCNHDSKSVIICKDKNSFDIKSAMSRLNEGLNRNGFYYGREWPYKNVKPCIIAEKYMIDEKTNDLRDYKFYCFDGVVKLLVINGNRNSNSKTTGDFFDREYNWLDFTWGFEHAKSIPEKPKNLEKMIEIAEKLSKGLIHARVDLYECNNKIYFGEITFYDGSGFDSSFNPAKWNDILGDYITLPLEVNKK